LDAYEMHVSAVVRLLKTANYDRLVYVSSTRVYDAAECTHEDAALVFSPFERFSAYAASKIAGEHCVLSANPNNRVVRLSNVYGASVRSGLFLSDILRQAVTTGIIRIRTLRESSKDYVSVDDVAEAIGQVARHSRQRVYNVASGRNTTHGDILEVIARSLPVEVCIAPGSQAAIARPIDATRLRNEFRTGSREVLHDIPSLVREFREHFAAR
jgi:nucleoside-diphosphate-sugar epimerase